MVTPVDEITELRKCPRCSLSNIALCRRMPEEALAELGAVSRRMRFEPEAVISAEGEPAVMVGNVVSGVVRLVRTLPDGRVQIVGLLHPTDMFGLPFRETSEFGAEAATEVELCIFDRRAFEAVVRRYPELEHEILVSVMTELDAAREWMVLLGTKSAMERVASYLLLIVKRDEISGCEQHGLLRAGSNVMSGLVHEIPVSRTDLGRYLGLTLETVSRQVSRLATDGVIRLVGTRRFVVLDRPRLVELAGTAIISPDAGVTDRWA